MADASDSKSDVGDYVWVQVPSPAVDKILRIGFCESGSGVFLFAANIILLWKIKSIWCQEKTLDTILFLRYDLPCTREKQEQLWKKS